MSRNLVNAYTKYGTLLVICIQVWLYFAIPQRTRGAMEALISYRLDQIEEKIREGKSKREALTQEVNVLKVDICNTQTVLTNIWAIATDIRRDLTFHISKP